MEMVLTMGAFEALDQQELFAVDGGGIMDWASAAAGAFAVGVGVCAALAPKVAVCAAIAANPVVIGVGIVCGVVAVGYGIYRAIND